MSWGAVAAGAAAVGSAALQANSAKKAGKKSAKGAGAAAQEAGRQFDITRGDTYIARESGYNAQNALNLMLGLPTVGRNDPTKVGSQVLQSGDVQSMLKRGMSIDDILKLGTLNPIDRNKINHLMDAYGLNADDINRLQSGTFSDAYLAAQRGSSAPTEDQSRAAFLESPDYQFRRTEGMRGLERTAAARGGAFSGNALRALNDFNSNLASQEFTNRFNRLAAIAGYGQTAVGQSASAGMQSAGLRGNALMNAGDARASGIIGGSNALAGGIQDLARLYGMGRRPSLESQISGLDWQSSMPWIIQN